MKKEEEVVVVVEKKDKGRHDTICSWASLVQLYLSVCLSFQRIGHYLRVLFAGEGCIYARRSQNSTKLTIKYHHYIETSNLETGANDPQGFTTYTVAEQRRAPHPMGHMHGQQVITCMSDICAKSELASCEKLHVLSRTSIGYILQLSGTVTCGLSICRPASLHIYESHQSSHNLSYWSTGVHVLFVECLADQKKGSSAIMVN